MPNLVPFSFENKQVRTVVIDGGPWFIAADVATCLGYSDAAQAVRDNCKRAKSLKELASVSQTGALPINSLAIPESDVYRLTMRSKLESAERFQDWVCEEVLPSIRKTGGYIAPSATPEQRLGLINQALSTLERLNQLDERDQVFFADQVRNLFYQTLPSPQDQEAWAVSDRVVVLTNTKPVKGDLIAIGRMMASAYRAEHGIDPVRRNQYVDGAPRRVNHYSGPDLEILDRVIIEYYAGK